MAEFSPKRPAEGGPPPFPPPKNNKRSSAKKASDKERDKSRINVGPAFPRWRALRAAKGLQLDSELAFLLLDAYERGSLVSAPSRRAVLPPAVSAARLSPSILEGQTDFDEDQVNSLEHCVIECESVSGETGQQREHSSDEDRAPPLHIRLGSALDKRPQLDNLPVIAAGEMVHDLPADLGPPAEKTAVPTEPHAVMREEDIVGSRAAIVYEESLRQLTALLHLPVTRCRHRMSSGLLCLGLPPFQSRVHQRRTAFVVEWVCPHGHVVWSWTSQPSLNFGMLAGDFLLGTNILLSGSDYAKVALLLRFMNMGVLSPGSFSRIQDRYCVDAVRDFWVERSAEAVQRLQGNHVVVLGSGSHDSA
ncbi:uncharacterized protein LOC115004506, partial [Cottoperca gobio]|uniref:Uncharacterized protein LOC115004506 n=1 Tax=Cottoperca gobio TaxID=56716 RepID=A0A6J2P923_COTGO